MFPVTKLLGGSRCAVKLTKFAACIISRTLSTTQYKHTEKEESSIKDNPYYAKYEDKLKQTTEDVSHQETAQNNRHLQRETQAWKRKIESFEKKLSHKKKEEESKISGLNLPARLDALIKTELLADKSPEEISTIWTEYWASKDSISAVISKDAFESMKMRIEECPSFLFPLPRDQGYEFFLSQFSQNHCFCTPVIHYQVHSQEAPWQLCFKFYPELIESKGIVLMASEFDSSALSLLEAQYLAQLQQLYYANPTEEQYDLVKCFNHRPDTFKYMDVIKQIESGNFIVKNN